MKAMRISRVLHDRYHIQSLLSRKTGRRTLLATDLETDSPVVIKLLLLGPDFTWNDLKLFEREAETLKSLDYPAIPKYLDFFEVETELGKGFALVQSYIEARSLQEWVQCGCTFSEADLKEIANQLLEVLEYLHTRQPPVIHRDIKPSNVLLSNRSSHSPGQVYLVDFGSVQTAQQVGTITVVGTYGYMPPEQFGGRSLPASDLYSVGTTLIYLATGQHPADLPQNDLHIEFESFTNLSQPFIHWIRWLTNPGLSKRPASANAAIGILQQGFQESLTQLSPQHFSVSTGCPSSKIKLQKTSATLDLTVPPDKFGSREIDRLKNKLTIPICLGCFSSLFSLFLFIAYLGWIGFLLWVLCITIAKFLFSKKDERFSSPYEITLQWKGNSIFVDVLSDSLKDSVKTSQSELKTLYAGHNDVPQYRLVFNCSDDSFYITGNRAEIQWLCDELNEWAGLEICYADYRTSGA